MSIILTCNQLILLSISNVQRAALCLPSGLPSGVEEDIDSASDTEILWAESAHAVWGLANILANIGPQIPFLVHHVAPYAQP